MLSSFLRGTQGSTQSSTLQQQKPNISHATSASTLNQDTSFADELPLVSPPGHEHQEHPSDSTESAPRPPVVDVLDGDQQRPPLPQSAPVVLMNDETLMNLAVDSLPLMQEGAQQAVLAAVATREQLLLKGAFAYNTWKSRARKRVFDPDPTVCALPLLSPSDMQQWQDHHAAAIIHENKRRTDQYWLTASHLTPQLEFKLVSLPFQAEGPTQLIRRPYCRCCDTVFWHDNSYSSVDKHMISATHLRNPWT